jgi:hypothetical protein
LKGVFRQIGRLAMSLGLIRLNQVGLDGTRVLANSSRHQTRGAESLADKLAQLDALLEQMLQECLARPLRGRNQSSAEVLADHISSLRIPAGET